jgi:putative PEP-CTERM system TPR-repeat lipoprotein
MHKYRNKQIAGLTVATAILLGTGLAGCGRSDNSAALVAEAKQFIQKGDNKAAVIQLKNALVKNPNDAEARIVLGMLYNETGDPASAEKEIRKAMGLGLADARVLPALATALISQGQFQKLLDDTAAGLDKASPELVARRGDAMLALGDTDKAQAAYEQALKAQPGLLAGLQGKARLAMSKRDLPGAQALAEEAVKANPKDANALMFKADLERAAGNVDGAMALYAEVIKLKPEHRSAHVERAFVEIGQKKYPEAQADLDAGKKAAPGSLMVGYAQALLDFNQNKFPAARDGLQKILKVAPEHMPSVLLAGAVEHALGEMQQAEQHLKKYMEKNPGNRYARKLLATTQLKLGQTADATATLAPILENAQDDAQLLALAGDVAMQARDYNKAAQYFEQASRLAPQAALLKTSLAMSRLALGDDARAIAELEQSARMDASSTKAGTLLVLTEMRQKHFDKALAAAKALEANQPKDASVLNLKGGVYLGMEDVPNAKAAFEASLKLQPGYLPAAVNLAQIFVKDKKPELARAQLLAVHEVDKKRVETMNALSELAAAQGNPVEATEWLEKAQAAAPEAIGPGIALASQYMRVDQKDKAMTLVRKLQVANPKAPELLDILAQVQLANKDTSGALESASKLIGLAPKSPTAYYRMATVHMALKNETAAADDLKKALGVKPDFIDAQLAQADLLVRKGQLDGALAVAREIEKQRPKEAFGYILEGNLLQRQGKAAAAVKPLEAAFALQANTPNLIKLHIASTLAGKGKEADARLAAYEKEHPNDLQLNMYIGENEIAAKRYRKAIEKFEATLKIMPKNPAALNNLAWAYQNDKDPRALKTAEAALAMAKDSPSVMDTVGWIKTEQGDTKGGLEMLQKALAVAPNALEIRMHLAAALAKAGDKAGAKRELEKVLANKDFPKMDEAKALAKTL